MHHLLVGHKWLDEEVLEDAPGFADLKIINMTIVFLEYTNRLKKKKEIHHISMNINICVTVKKLEY